MKRNKTKSILTVLGGSLKNEKITLDLDQDLRPTRSVVKEAVFQVWCELINDAAFLDLFSGSGAMAIEALSRGASSVSVADVKTDFLNKLKKRLKDIEKKRPGIIESRRIEILQGDFKEVLGDFFARQQKFDLIYLDPPYNSGFGIEAIRLISRYELLDNDGRIMLEVSKRERLSVEKFIDGENIAWLLKSYKHGDTFLYHLVLDEDD